MVAPFAREVIVIRDGTAERNGLGRLIFAATVLVNAGSCMGATGLDSAMLGLLAFGSFLLFPLCLFYLFAGARRPIEATALTIEGNELVLEHRGTLTRLPFGKVRGAWVERDTLVAIVMTNGEIVTMNLGSAGAADEMVSQLGHTKEQRTLTMPVAGWAKTSLARGMIAAALSVTFLVTGVFALVSGGLLHDIFSAYRSAEGAVTGGSVAATIGLVATSLLLARATRPRWVVVGSDGVRLADGKIVHHTDIQRADPDPAGVRITRKDGSQLLVAFSQGADAAAVWVERQFALLSRIERWKDNASRTAEEAKLDVLDRAGRSAADHRKALLAVGDTSAGYRAQGVSAEDLERVIDDAESPAERRIAATVALSAIDRDRATQKIRVVVPTCVDPRLRTALEHAAEEADFEAGFEAEQARSRSRQRMS